MLLTVSLLVMLYLFVIIRAVQFFLQDGPPVRDDDKTVGAVIIAASVMFIIARITTFVIHPNEVESNNTAVALWVGFGLLNAMLYLGLLHRMTAFRAESGQRRMQPVEKSHNDKYRTAA